MRFGLLKFLFVTLFALYAVPAVADPEEKKEEQKQQEQEQEKKPDGVYLSKKEYDELVANQKKKDEGGGGDDDPLRKKAQKDREDRERADSDAKSMESAISFTMGLDDFVSKNSDLLPSEIGGIVKAANGEKYDTQTAKAAAVKKAIVDCYFSVQANVDSLTAGQKTDLSDYQKLTKEGKEARASAVYAQLFEPCLEMNRRILKAQELGRGGGTTASGSEAAYRDKMIAAASKKYLGK